MSEITKYVFEDAEVRVVVGEDGEPWFVASDVCRALGHTNTSVAVSRLEEADRNTLNTGQGGRGNPNVNVVSEAGLYELIMTSRVVGAKPFKRWITHEVLPSIRKTGGYGQQDALAALSDPATLRQLLGDYAERVQALEADVDAARPKVEVYDRIVATGDTVGFREAAKLIRAATGANEREVCSLLIARGWIQRLGRRLAPAHYGEKQKYVTTRDREWVDRDGEARVKPELRVTQKGVARAIELLIAEAA